MRLLRGPAAFYVAKACFVGWGALRRQSYKKALFAKLRRTLWHLKRNISSPIRFQTALQSAEQAE